MGEHKGWRTYQRGDRFYSAVWQPATKTYETKSCATQGDANEHGKREAGKIAAGVRVAEKFPTRTADLARDFVADLRGAGRSASHCNETDRLLKQLAKSVPDLAAPNAGRLISVWLDGLRLMSDETKPVSPVTRNRHLVMVRALVNWAINWKKLTDDPTTPIMRANEPDYLAEVFTLEEIGLCLAKTEWKVVREGNDPRDPYHLFFAVLIYTGMRFGEAAQLHWEDIDWSGRMIIVKLRAGAKIKRQRERLVPLQGELAELLEPYRDRTGPMFPTLAHNPYRGFQNFVKRAGVVLGDRSPHSCRHSYSGIMTATGVPGSLLSAYLGHTSAATTMGYTKLSMRYVHGTEGWPRGVLLLRPKPRANLRVIS